MMATEIAKKRQAHSLAALMVHGTGVGRRSRSCGDTVRGAAVDFIRSVDWPLVCGVRFARGPGSVDEAAPSAGSVATGAPPPSERASNRSASHWRALPNLPWDATCTSFTGRRGATPYHEPGSAH